MNHGYERPVLFAQACACPATPLEPPYWTSEPSHGCRTQTAFFLTLHHHHHTVSHPSLLPEFIPAPNIGLLIDLARTCAAQITVHLQVTDLSPAAHF